MFKKILAVFIGFACISNVAMAEVDLRTDCIEKGAWINHGSSGGLDGSMIKADYAIYFDNDESNIPQACEPGVKELVGKLAKERGDIDAILMFGSADGTGSADHNAELARDRVNTVAELLENKGFSKKQLCAYGSDNKLHDEHCARVSMGDTIGRVAGSFHYLRAVFMYVIYKRDKCGETVAVLDALIDKITDTTVKTELQKVKAYCPDTDTLLTQSQRNEIMSAINHAIEEYPEAVEYVTESVDISNEEKVRLLKNTLVYIGDEYARDVKNAPVSVWKAADGGFNYARLASDSIAGVVLGTAGGLITSKVVKKNQLKRGFENVSCTIGGQSVASYGDEFTVGFQELR